MAEICHGRVAERGYCAGGYRNAGAVISQLSGLISQALQWWQRRQQRRRELKLLCAREFAGYGGAIRRRR